MKMRMARAVTTAFIASFGAATLAGAGASHAQQAMTPQTQAEVLVGVEAQTREDEIDDLRRYVSETTTTTTLADGRSHERHNRQQFDLQTIAVTANGLLIRFTLREAEAQDVEQPWLGSLIGAWKDVPLEVATNRAGTPQRIVNWPRARDAYTEALARLAPDYTEETTGVVNALNAMEEGPRASAVVADLLLLSTAQPRGPVREGRIEAPVETVALSPSASVAVTRFAEFRQGDATACIAQFSSGTTMTAASRNASNTEALQSPLSTYDGWVIDLEQTSETIAPAGRMLKVVTLRRDAPGCS
ncbi:MAG: hypothetical protein ACRED4_08625 [Brevundimonas sp.]